MTRNAPCSVPFITCYVVVKVNDGVMGFQAMQDYQFYKDNLKECLKLQGIALHAYVITPENIQLIMTPSDRHAVAIMLEDINKIYSMYMQDRYHYSQKVWSSHYHISMLQEGEPLLACYKYIEAESVRKETIDHPAEYKWSSYSRHAHGYDDALITLHDSYLCLGRCEQERQELWQQLHQQKLSATEIFSLENALIENEAIGDKKFISEIHKAIKHNKRSRQTGLVQQFA